MSGAAYQGKRETALAALSLFASAGTLLCCALPALLVSLGMGAVMAGLAANVPGLIWVSENKVAVFIAAALLLAAAGVMLWQARYLPCPADPVKAAACTKLRKLSLWIYWTALVFYTVGAFFAFFAAKLLL